MLRSIGLFIHVISAMGVFAGLGIEGLVLFQLRRAASAADVAAALRGYGLVRRVASASLVATLVSGMYLAITVWGGKGAWINVGFASLVLLGAISGVMTGRTVARLAKAVAEPGLAVAERTLRRSFVLRLSMLVGVVFLMTVKPALSASLIVMAVAIAGGLLAGVVGSRQARGGVVLGGA
jgi:uncharacterized membrane protein